MPKHCTFHQNVLGEILEFPLGKPVKKLRNLIYKAIASFGAHLHFVHILYASQKNLLVCWKVKTTPSKWFCTRFIFTHFRRKFTLILSNYVCCLSAKDSLELRPSLVTLHLQHMPQLKGQNNLFLHLFGVYSFRKCLKCCVEVFLFEFKLTWLKNDVFHPGL